MSNDNWVSQFWGQIRVSFDVYYVCHMCITNLKATILSWYLLKLCNPACPEDTWGTNCSNTCQCSHALTCDKVKGCVCQEGWSGTKCDINVNECERNPCTTLQACVDTMGSYTCDCVGGFRKVANGTCESMFKLNCLFVVGIYLCRLLCLKSSHSLIVWSWTERYDLNIL